MRRLLGTALFCTLAAAAVGCEQLPDREFAALESALTLRVVEITTAGVDHAQFDLELTNGGASRAHACLGPGRSVTGLSGGGSFSMVSHPGCEREFQLDAGGVLAWSETHEVTVPGGAPVEAAITIQILNPRRCSSVGCAGFMVESRPRTISRPGISPVGDLWFGGRDASRSTRHEDLDRAARAAVPLRVRDRVPLI